MKKTPLYERHLALGATMTEFGGWTMPVQYTSILEEHRNTRTLAGLFDVCHMGEIEVRGPQALDLLQWVMSRNLADQRVGEMKLSAITNERGGIIDDVTVYKRGEGHYMVVTNAATREGDLEWILRARRERGLEGAAVTDRSDAIGKVDIQGPLAQKILAEIAEGDLETLRFYHALDTRVAGMPALVSRSGYTGEDGFEVYTEADRIGEIWDLLMRIGDPHGLKPAGLGARDTLRLEAGMMLYGNEMCQAVTPFEVVYGWITDLDKEFIGRDALRKQKESGVRKKLVGFEIIGRGIARHGYPVLSGTEKIGEVTSGTLSPTLGKAIGMAFVPVRFTAPGTELEIEIRGQRAKARVVPLPFYRGRK
ncbi:MAG: glycine cleavage system aminomethyltransferase GcvT [Syntrophaceae bacterium]|nr:glycine cleavage system aminomethyltransferase GcvT [Syntrophaceae bacterium]